jgi:beta-glucosidase
VAVGALGVVTGASGPGAARAGTAPPSASACPWVGSTAPISARVAELLGRMTTAQKVSMVHGLDSNTDASSSGPVYAGDTAVIPALCIPALHLEDGPAGVGDAMTGVTQFPAPVALAATFDPATAEAYGAAVGAEQRGKGTNVELGPTVNIVRDPRWGRAFESLGEDPYLSGQMAAAEIEGVQSQGVIDMVKHLGVYNEETLRDTPADDAVVSERAMQEIYLPAFEAALHQGHAGAVMCSYNEVDGTPACQDPYLLSQVLDGQFGFSGFVSSDWFATKSSAASVAAGLDMQMPDSCYYGQALGQDLVDGAVTESELDTMVSRILTSMFAEGLFDHPHTGSPGALVATPAHAALARDVAEEGTVLLKDAGAVLPLEGSRVRSIAVIGADAGSGADSAGGGSAAVSASSVVTPYQGIARRAGPGVEVTYDDGSNLAAAAMTARAAQVAIVFAALPEAEGQDLATIGLPPGDDQLIEAVAAANPHTVVVLNTGSAVAMPWISQVPAVVEAWYPGQEDGDAIAAVLFGDVDPSGKLPVTFPVDLAQVPAHTPVQWPGIGVISYSEGIDVGYRYYDAEGETPLFPFGYGLSYTTFRFQAARLTAGPTPAGRLSLQVSITDTGSRPGADVVQLYLHDPPASQEPPDQLKGFQRVFLQPGRTATVSFALFARDLAAWDPAVEQWVVAPGTYQLRLGDSSRHLPLALSVRVPQRIVVGASTPPPPPAPSALSSALSAAADAACPKDLLAPVVNGGLTVPSDAYSLTGQPSPF